MIYSSAYSLCRTQRHALCRKLVAATTSHRSYNSCTGCPSDGVQSSSWHCWRKRRSTLCYHRTSLATVNWSHQPDVMISIFRRSYAKDHANVYAIWRPLLPVCSCAAIEQTCLFASTAGRVIQTVYNRQLRSRLLCWDCDVLRLLYNAAGPHLTYLLY